jgi:hypothetical protein
VVQATYSVQTIRTGSTFTDTGLTASITPTSATNRILVIVSQQGIYSSTSNVFCVVRLLRGASVINTSGSLGSTTAGNLYSPTISICFLDSPATTSSTTYKTQFADVNNVAGVGVQVSNETSTIILMEIAA